MTEDLNLVLEAIAQTPKPIIHICSGSSGIGDIRLDRYFIKSFDVDGAKRFRDAYIGSPNVLGDMFKLPFKNSVAGSIICDPPYDSSLFKGQDFDFNISPLVDEMIRILKPTGILYFYAPWILKHPTIKLIKIIPSKIGIDRSYYKLLSVSKKVNGQIGDYV